MLLPFTYLQPPFQRLMKLSFGSYWVTLTDKYSYCYDGVLSNWVFRIYSFVLSRLYSCRGLRTVVGAYGFGVNNFPEPTKTKFHSVLPHPTPLNAQRKIRLTDAVLQKCDEIKQCENVIRLVDELKSCHYLLWARGILPPWNLPPSKFYPPVWN